MSSSAPADDGTPDSLVIRPPLQRRSREAWERVLDAGVVLLEQGGYEAFTIAAVCELAHVAPRALYDRADTKDALFLAVYEHGMARVRAEEAVFGDEGTWRGLPADQLARDAVRRVVGIFNRHAAFLRSVVLVSGVHPEIHRRGARYSQELGEAFTGLLLASRHEVDQPDPATAIGAAFNALFAALVLRVAYGPAFATPAMDDETFVETFSAMIRSYLFGT